MKAIRLTIALAFIMISAYAFFSIGMLGERESVKQYVLSEHWTIEDKGMRLNDVDLHDYKAMNVIKGETVTLTNMLPDCGIPGAVMITDNRLAALEVYIDGERIYSSGTEALEKGKLVGYGRQIVKLPLGYEGKEIKIVHRAGENNGIGTIMTPVIMPAADAAFYLLRKSFIPAAVSITGMLIGLSMIGVAVVYISENKYIKQMLYIGFFSFFIGIWSSCDHDVILLINGNYQVKTISEYIALYIAPIFVFAYYWSKIKEKATYGEKVAYRSILIGYCGLTTVTLFLQVFNLFHLTSMVRVQHGGILIIIAYILVGFVRSIINRNKEMLTFYIGVVALGLCGFLDIVRFNLLTYSSNISGSFDGITYVGAAILIITMVMDFADEMSNKVRQSSEIELYEQMANSDFLTGLANRRQCELVFDEIDQEDSDYAVIAFDLNNLKTVNDKYGHTAGDKLLKEFADILKTVFDSVATVGRTGGDEFLVIIRHADILNLDQMLARLDEKIDFLNKRKRDYNISAARGVCTKKDNKKNVRLAYRTADQRMYENKIQMKADMKGIQS